jgi:hypothetical protein
MRRRAAGGARYGEWLGDSVYDTGLDIPSGLLLPRVERDERLQMSGGLGTHDVVLFCWLLIIVL